MQQAARYAAAIGILDAWLDGLPIEQALTRWARGSRYAGSKDRAAVRDHVYATLRQMGSCAAAGGSETGRGLILGLLRLQGVPTGAIFSGISHAPDALNEAEAAFVAPPLDPVRDVPEWALPLLQPRAPDALPTLLAQFANRAPLWLRVNTRRTSRADAATSLATDGLKTETHPNVPTALEVVEGGRRLHLSAAFNDGLVEPQDLSVQLAINRIDWPQVGKILDFCAGGGGKALAIADRTDASIYAHDAIPRRMGDLAPRAERAGVQIAEVSLDGARSLGPFDVVLTDVPCSGSGTWRRDPEAKWRLTPEGLEELTTSQAEILDEAAALVAPGGRLIYMTCSFFEAENEAQIEAFLARNSGWRAGAQHLDTPLTASDGFFSTTLCRA